MNGHQLDRYRRRCRQRYRMLWRRFVTGGRTENLFRESMVGDPALDPWCVESHESCRKRRADREWPTTATPSPF